MLGEYFTGGRKRHRFASARTNIDGKQTHDGFDSGVLLATGFIQPAGRGTTRPTMKPRSLLLN
jgi:hypothetical protein